MRKTDIYRELKKALKRMDYKRHAGTITWPEVWRRMEVHRKKRITSTEFWGAVTKWRAEHGE